jgi:hypothetical protein
MITTSHILSSWFLYQLLLNHLKSPPPPFTTVEVSKSSELWSLLRYLTLKYVILSDNWPENCCIR